MLSLLRIVLALSFSSAWAREIHWISYGAVGTADAASYAAGVIEVTGSLLLILGLFARPAAFVMSGEIAVAYFMLRPAKSFFPLVNGGELEALFCFVFFYFFIAGPGPWSL
ncbi:MAG: DoxX family protein [Hyphomicrobiales bacterium]|nr:DoxX family protein [Hyphomicrobiales bacterium]